MDYGNGSSGGIGGSDSGSGGGGGGNNHLRPGDELQVSTDGWRAAGLSFQCRRREPETSGLRPDGLLGSAPEPRALLIISGDKALDLTLSPNKTHTVPRATEHLYLGDGFIAALATATTLELRAEQIDDFASAPAAMRKLIESARDHYPCPQGCEWHEADPGAFTSGAYTFHDGMIGVQFRVHDGALVGLHWLNRQRGHVVASSLMGRVLTRQPLDGKWFIGGHSVTPRTHAT